MAAGPPSAVVACPATRWPGRTCPAGRPAGGSAGRRAATRPLNRSIADMIASENVVYVGHLPTSATEADLRPLFANATLLRIARKDDHSTKG